VLCRSAAGLWGGVGRETDVERGYEGARPHAPAWGRVLCRSAADPWRGVSVGKPTQNGRTQIDAEQNRTRSVV